MRKTGVYRLCAHCGKEFYVIKSHSLIPGRSKYCSRSCCSKAHVHLLHERRRDSYKEAGRRQLAKLATRVKVDETAHSQWKGDAVGYKALHDWLRKHHGRPNLCEVCGTTDPNKNYEWANLSHEYRRDRKDFKRMCISCHRRHDWATVRKKKARATA